MYNKDMELQKIIDRAIDIRAQYSELEIRKYGKKWTNEQIVQGFVGDVGDLMKLVMAKEGIREYEKVDEKLEHELADCLWSLLVISNNYGINIEKSFLKTMDKLEESILSEK